MAFSLTDFQMLRSMNQRTVRFRGPSIARVYTEKWTTPFTVDATLLEPSPGKLNPEEVVCGEPCGCGNCLPSSQGSLRIMARDSECGAEW